MRSRTIAGALAGVVAAGGLLAGTAYPTAAVGDRHPQRCEPRQVNLDDVDAGEHWAPLTPSKWEFPGDEVVLTEPGTAPAGPRRPFEYAVLTTGPELTSLSYEAEVRLDESTAVSNRDVVLIWNYQSPTRFYYAHLSQDNTIYPHNGIFVVDDADRRRIDDQWNGSVGAPPAVDDMDWHDVRLTYDAASGATAVFVDGAEEPLMTATDTTFSGGRVGFGSFDNFGRARDVEVTGTPVLAAERLRVTAPPLTRSGGLLPVLVRGLDRCEAYTVSVDGVVVGEGRAARSGTAVELVRVPRLDATRVVDVSVTGSQPDRLGSDRVRVLAR